MHLMAQAPADGMANIVMLSNCTCEPMPGHLNPCSWPEDTCVQVEPYPKDFGRALGTALDFHFQEHMGMLKQLVGLTGALPVSGEDSPQTTLKRFVPAPRLPCLDLLQCTGHALPDVRQQGCNSTRGKLGMHVALMPMAAADTWSTSVCLLGDASIKGVACDAVQQKPLAFYCQLQQCCSLIFRT